MSKNRKVARLTRSERIGRRLRAVETTSGFNLKRDTFNATVSAVVPSEIHGFILEQGNDRVVLRHRRTSASKRTVVSVFPLNDVVEVYQGAEGIGAVTVMRQAVIHTYSGVSNPTVKGSLTTFTTDAGETITVNTDRYTLTISADDVEGGNGKGKRKAKKAEADEKPRRKKKRRVEEDDDLDD